MNIYPELIVFLAFIVFWHVFEFLSQGLFHKKFSLENLLISAPYLLALSLGLIEYYIKELFFPSVREALFPLTLYVGIIAMFTGQLIRSLAIIQAKTAFTHAVRNVKVPGHILVRYGVYKFSRHPAYMGWYLWALGSQVLLGNPVSFIIYLIWGWRFLYDRIRNEEKYLVAFFGEEYEKYRKEVPSRIPFI